MVQCIDVVEELDCFEVYVKEIYNILKKKEVVGCCFDFMMQEFNCELNILVLKLINVEVINFVIELKVFIE